MKTPNFFNKSYSQAKHYFDISASSPYGVCLHIIPEFAKVIAATVLKTVGKVGIHAVRFIHDAVVDSLELILNMIRTKPEFVEKPSSTENDSKTNSEETSGIKKFIMDTWNEKDESFLGKCAKDLDYGKAPLIKLGLDSLCLLQEVLGDVIFLSKETAKAPWVSFSKACKGAHEAFEAEQLSNIEIFTDLDSGFECIINKNSDVEFSETAQDLELSGTDQKACAE